MLHAKKSREFWPNFSDFIDCLLGKESPALWLTEFYAESELLLVSKVLSEVAAEATLAYLDPFENLQTVQTSKKPDLVLKPNSLEEAILMSIEMLKTKIIDLVILDSIFLLPYQKEEPEDALLKLVKSAEQNKKPVFLLNPNTGIKKRLERHFQAFCLNRIQVL